MKTIKIFLGSSITELHYERLHFGDYLMNSVHPIFQNDGVEIKVVKCEDIRSGNTGENPQERIDNLLKECDISVFMFKTRAGKATVHEFDVARKLQKSKRHEIYIFCFDVNEAKDKSLKDFQKRLEKKTFYWYECKDVSDLESQFVLGLLKYERQLLGLTKPSIVEQESETEKDGDTLFAKYQQNEQNLQAPLREKIHQNIEELMQQTKTVMEDKNETIAARIFKMKELYEKADRWAAATDYDKEKYSDLLFDYAGFLYDYGLYHDSEAVYLRQIKLAEELYSTKHPDIAVSYNNIGWVYTEQCDYDKALEYYDKALAIYKKNLGPKHPDIATSYNNIGVVYYEQNKYDKALKYYKKALAIREKVLGPEHPDTTESYGDIGVAYDNQGDYDKALEYLQKALTIREKVLGLEHPDTAESCDNIGVVYFHKGNYDKALEYYFKVLAIREKIFGTKNIRVAISYSGIGMAYFYKVDYDQALEYLFKCLTILEKLLITKSPSIAALYGTIGKVYYHKGNYDKALEYYQKALAISEKVFGIEHPSTATSYHNVGMAYYKQGDYGKAREYLTKAYQIRKKRLGDDHPDTKDVLQSINVVKEAMNSSIK